jgi:predicted metal-dependent phosphoesterase TrpH
MRRHVVTLEAMLHADLHHHTDTDPIDGPFVSYTAAELIDRAVADGLNVLAITCHESMPYDDSIVHYARGRGVLLLRGMEATVEGHHVLLVNFRDWPNGRCTMDDIRACKHGEALVIAPHPFYPAGVAGGVTLEAHRGVFDAVEFSGLYTPLTRRFNRRALEYAASADLPVVGNSDTHFLWQLGRTYTLIDAPPEPDAVIAAIRHGRVQLVTRPLTWRHIVRFVVESKSTVNVLRDSMRYMLKVLRRTRRAAQQPHPAVPQVSRERFVARKAL